MSKKVSVTLTEEQFGQGSDSASGLRQSEIEEKDPLDELLDEMDAQYGPPPPEAVAWAKSVLGVE